MAHIRVCFAGLTLFVFLSMLTMKDNSLSQAQRDEFYRFVQTIEDILAGQNAGYLILKTRQYDEGEVPHNFLHEGFHRKVQNQRLALWRLVLSRLSHSVQQIPRCGGFDGVVFGRLTA